MTKLKYSIPIARKLRRQLFQQLRIFGRDGCHMNGPEETMLDMAKLIDWTIHRKGDSAYGRADDPDFNQAMAEENDTYYQRRQDAILSMLDQYRQCIVTNELLFDIALTVAGNYDSLRNCEEWRRWDGTGSSWAPLFTLDCRRSTNPKKRTYLTKFKSYGGTTAASAWSSSMGAGTMRGIITDTGLAKFGNYLPEDLSGMWFIANLRQGPRGVEYEDVYATSSMLKWNRDLMRRRRETCEGPYEKARGRKCVYCPLGRDRCGLARLEKSWEVRDCPNGHKGYFDPDDEETDRCLSCIRTGKWRKRD